MKVGPGFFDAMGIPVVAGRDFTTTDREGTLPVTIVNRAQSEDELGEWGGHIRGTLPLMLQDPPVGRAVDQE